MPTKDNVHPITDADLDMHRDTAEFRMQNVPMRGVAYDLLAEVRKLPNVGGYLLSEDVSRVLHVLRRGLCLYYELCEELSGTVDVRQAAFLGSFALFGLGALVAQELPAPEGENLASFPKPSGAFFKVGLGADDDLKALLSFYLKAVTQTQPDGSAIIETPADLVNLTRDYWSAARDQMIADADQQPAELLERVEAATFRIGNLELRGFNASAQAVTATATFSPVLPEQVVGNTAAKQSMLRYMDRLALYDAERAMNPVLELGGLPSTVLFDGFPGTGKTSLFRMAMTRLKERGEQVGLPVHFELIDPGIKDEYYGKTGKQLRARLETTADPRRLVLVFFDDIDLLLVSRDSGGASDNGSDKDVLTITMQFLDGIMTKNNGSFQTYAATNEPTATDAALRQRFHHREQIGGPEDWDDYAALIGIKLARQISNGLVQVSGELPNALAASRTNNQEPRTVAQPVPGVFQNLKTKIQNRQMSWRELGELCAEFKRKDPRFTGRPIESVTQRLLAESADFDVPPEWFSEPALYLSKSYDERVALLKSLYRPLTGEMIAAALEQYFVSEQRYADTAKSQRAQRIAADMEAQLQAREIITQRETNDSQT